MEGPSRQWRGVSPINAPLEGASVVFERGRRTKPEIDEEQVKELHAKIAGEAANAMRSRERLNAVANSFLERKLKPWGGK